jgi:hypothetical protein
MCKQRVVLGGLWLLFLVGLCACQQKPITPTVAAAITPPAFVFPLPVQTTLVTVATESTPPVTSEATIPLRTPTSILIPTLTPTAAAIINNNSRGMWFRISQQGQLAYINDRALYVEHPIHSHQFQMISAQVGDANWSPDGSMLLYTEWYENGEGQFYLWFAEQGTTSSITEWGIPLPNPIEPDYDQLYPCSEPLGQWLPDSQRILLPMRLEQDTNADTDEYVTLIDLKDKTFEVLSPIHNTRGCTAPINNDLFLQVMVYSNASVVKAINYAGEQLWTRMIDRLFLSDLIRAIDGDFVFLVYPEWEGNPVSTIARMNLYTGEETVFWQAEPGERIAALAFSSEQQILSLILFFGTRDELFLDKNGEVVAAFAGEWPHWQPNGELALYPHGRSNGFTYVRRSDLSLIQEVELPIWSLTVHSWSPGGQYLLCESWDNVTDIHTLYFWQPGMTTPSLFWQGQPGDYAADFQWDNLELYFIVNGLEFWVYEATTAEMILLAD